MCETMFMYFLLYILTSSIMLLKITAFSIPMISIESPELQIMPKNLTSQERHQFLVNVSLSRVSRYHISNTSMKLFEGDVWLKLSSYYVTQLFFGTSSNLFAPFFILDTGDDKTWVQCDGCNPCFQVKDGNIHIQNSVTYKYLSVDDPRCEPKYTYLLGICGYISNYGGGVSSSKGPMGTDTFMFIETSTQKPIFFENIAFGCGLHNERISFGFNKGPNNEIHGVFGLSPGPQSFLTQLDSHIQGKFMYCLASMAEPQPFSKSSAMYFGPEANIQEPNVQHIQMYARKRYHLYFRGISVEGKRLPIDTYVCPIDTRGTSTGFYIDSGAPMTNLPPGAYQPLRSAIVNYFAKYNWMPVGGQGLDLCYFNTPKEGQSYPTVTFHFRGVDQGEVDWVMDKDNMFLHFEQTEGFCMVINENKKPGFCLFGA